MNDPIHHKPTHGVFLVTNGTESRNIASIITTSLAAFLNLLVLLVICFGLMRQIDGGIARVEKNQQTIEDIGKDLQESKTMIKKLSDLLDEKYRNIPNKK